MKTERNCQFCEYYKDGYCDNLELNPCYPQKGCDDFSKRKTGHWIAVENEEMETVGYYCSECDLPIETEQRTNFCSNCGAKMENTVVIERSLCDSCVTKGCIFQSGIVRNHCDFYKAESEEAWKKEHEA